jgi:hypothetical protein
VRGRPRPHVPTFAFRVVPPVHCCTMRDVTSPVLDPADAGRGLLHALQALLLGLSLLLIL